jgi:hypothetical protein
VGRRGGEEGDDDGGMSDESCDVEVGLAAAAGGGTDIVVGASESPVGYLVGRKKRRYV